MSFYSNLKEKEKRIVREISWYDTLLSVLVNMFTYEGVPVRTEFIETYCNMYGDCAIWETPWGWSVTPAERAGFPNTNGQGTDLICTTGNGKSVTFKDFENPESPDYKKVVYIKNDRLANPDTRFTIYADLLTEIESSIRAIVRNSRLMPIVVCKDEKTRTAVNNILDDLNLGGKLQAVISKNLLAEDGDGVSVINITDVGASDKIQYLYKAIDDTLRHFYNRVGMEVCGASKMAQQTTAEINAGCNSHEIIPDERLKERQRAVSECAEKFGWNCSVRYSDPWKKEISETVENSVDPEESEEERKEIVADEEENV